mmetsp:Transcript_40605/g.129029  ORF Transcript_40605/g.129029 Transcript_40605/m.129029 type:complete len:267 (+) Transcript_40605:18-818(+)
MECERLCRAASVLAQDPTALLEQLLPPGVFLLCPHEHLAQDFMLHRFLLGGPIVCHDLHGTLQAKLHLLVVVADCAACVLLVNDVGADGPAPLPALLRADLRLHLSELVVDLPQGLRHGRACVRCPSPALLLDVAAHLPEAQALHGLLRVVIVRAAADDDGGTRVTVKRRLQEHCKLAVMEGHAWRLTALLHALLALVECGDAALECQKSLVDVVCLCDALAGRVVILPGDASQLLVARFQAARRLHTLVGLALAHPLGTSQVHER